MGVDVSTGVGYGFTGETSQQTLDALSDYATRNNVVPEYEDEPMYLAEALSVANPDLHFSIDYDENLGIQTLQVFASSAHFSSSERTESVPAIRLAEVPSLAPET